MTENKTPKIVLLRRWEKIFTNELTKEEAGQIIKAMYEYAFMGTRPQFTDRAMKWFWRDIEETLDYVNRR